MSPDAARMIHGIKTVSPDAAPGHSGVIRNPGEPYSDKLTVWTLTAALDGTGYCLDGWAKKRTTRSDSFLNSRKGNLMNNIVYIIGAIVIIIAILSFFGLR